MTHYERLGVSPLASPADIRRAYLARARRSHPDVAEPGAPADMVALNDAWAVLSNDESRARYDAEIGVGEAIRPRSLVDRPTTTPFVPHRAYGTDGDDDSNDDDDWRYQPDVGDPRTAPGRLALLAPVALLMAAAAVFATGLLLNMNSLLAGAAVLAGLGVVAFLVAPMSAMGKASRYE